ncbi:MAG: hypothetical protein ACFFCQ_07305 [Promethearchaeota archaeon]
MKVIWRDQQHISDKLFLFLILCISVTIVLPVTTGNAPIQSERTFKSINDSNSFPFNDAILNFTVKTTDIIYLDNDTILGPDPPIFSNASVLYSDVTAADYKRTLIEATVERTERFSLETGGEFWIPLTRLDPEVVVPNKTIIAAFYIGSEPFFGREYTVRAMTSNYRIQVDVEQEIIIDAWILSCQSTVTGGLTGNWTLYFSMEHGVLVGATYTGIRYVFQEGVHIRRDVEGEWTLYYSNINFTPGPDTEGPIIKIESPDKGNFENNVIFNVSVEDPSRIYRVIYTIRKQGQTEVLATGELGDPSESGYYTGFYRQSLKPGTYNLTITAWDWKLNLASYHQKMSIPTPFLETMWGQAFLAGMGLLFIIIVIAFGITSWRRYYGDWRPPVPYQIYVINDMGLSVFDRQYSEQEIEAQLISGFLTAISSFMAAITVEEEKGDLGGKAQNNLKSVQKGDLTMQLEWGKFTAVACMLPFESYFIRRKLRKFQREFETAFQSDLEFYMGDISVFEPAKIMLDKIILKKVRHDASILTEKSS